MTDGFVFTGGNPRPDRGGMQQTTAIPGLSSVFLLCKRMTDDSVFTGGNPRPDRGGMQQTTATLGLTSVFLLCKWMADDSVFTGGNPRPDGGVYRSAPGSVRRMTPSVSFITLKFINKPTGTFMSFM
jgi:hypothetical protein